MKRFSSWLPSSIFRSVARRPIHWVLGLVGLCSVLFWQGGWPVAAIAQDSSVKNQEEQVIRQYELPPAPAEAPAYEPRYVPQPPPAPEPAYEPPAAVEPPAPNRAEEPAPQPAEPKPSDRATTPEPNSAVAKEPEPTGPLSQYVLEFNRSPAVGNRFRLQGTFAEARLGFTRPQAWTVKSAKALIRYQHSPALIASKSNLTVRVNGTSVGSVPLNKKEAQIGEALLTIPANVLQDFNELTLVAQHNNDPKCSDPADPTLWTEVLPDSQIRFNFQPKPITLDFGRYPYPFFDPLSLDANQIAYLQPKQPSAQWMTLAARLQASLGRIAEFRPIETRLIQSLGQAKWNDRIALIGTPEEQPLLKTLKLPYKIAGNKVMDGSRNPLPDDVGVLMLAVDQGLPILIATGNGPEGVEKAVRALTQPTARKANTGAATLVTELQAVGDPNPRQWQGYLPVSNSFTLKDLTTEAGKPFDDVTVRGSYTPAIEIDFRPLPDEQLVRGSSMQLVYSYSPQVNPRLSTVEVRLDGVPIGGKKLASEEGATHETLNVDLPEKLVKFNSKLQVAFNLVPREPANCGKVTDQQLWGKVHTDTSFKLNRLTSVELPDLKLFQAGFPFSQPQDLSQLAIAMPDQPSATELLTLLTVSERLGRLSHAEAVNLAVYPAQGIDEGSRRDKHWIGIGTQKDFPLPGALQESDFRLQDKSTRQTQQGQLQTLPDRQGVIQQVLSPWNKERVVLALTAQSEAGLTTIPTVLQRDPLFFQLQGDTTLVSATTQKSQSFDPSSYVLESFQHSRPTRIENSHPLARLIRFLSENWYLLLFAIVTLALLLYGVVQLYLKRVALGDPKK